MKTASDLLQDLARKNVAFHATYRHPFIHIAVHLPAFDHPSSSDDREADLCRVLGWQLNDLWRLLHYCGSLRLHTLQAEEYNEYRQSTLDREHNWLSAALSIHREPLPDAVPAQKDGPKVVHFYSVRGGQGRSSCLAFVAQTLARDGQRVLAVDANFDAPSLDVLYGPCGAEMDRTILGLWQDLVPASPMRVCRFSNGSVDLLAYRPSSPKYDIEAYSLAMQAVLDPQVIKTVARSIYGYAQREGYDSVLIDHQSGLTPYILPWIHALPRRLALFSRPDWLWMAARGPLRTLLSTVGSEAGVLVIADRRADESDHLPQINCLRRELSLPKERVVRWPWDPAFCEGQIPHIEGVRAETADAARKLTGLLGLSA